jgi:hypothetical protein
MKKILLYSPLLLALQCCAPGIAPTANDGYNTGNGTTPASQQPANNPYPANADPKQGVPATESNKHIPTNR